MSDLRWASVRLAAAHSVPGEQAARSMITRLGSWQPGSSQGGDLTTPALNNVELASTRAVTSVCSIPDKPTGTALHAGKCKGWKPHGFTAESEILRWMNMLPRLPSIILKVSSR